MAPPACAARSTAATISSSSTSCFRVLDGFEVLRQLRLRSNLPVIMLTARAEEQDRVQGFDDGVDDYLVKPFAARGAPRTDPRGPASRRRGCLSTVRPATFGLDRSP